MRVKGFTLIEILLVISLFSLLFLFLPGLSKTSLVKLTNQEEVQRLIDQLRLAQRRAILHNIPQYLTIDPTTKGYHFYEISGADLKTYHLEVLEDFQSIEINRSVSGMNHTFYFTPRGTPVFGCTISLRDQYNLWRVVIAVGSGRIRLVKEGVS